MIAARRSGIPYLVTFHTGGHTLRHRNALRSIQWRLVGPLLRNAVSLIGVSRFEADSLSELSRLRGKPVAVIRNGGTLPPASQALSPVPGRIVSSARLERYKGHHRVIEALPYIIGDVPDAHLLVLGKGPYKNPTYGPSPAVSGSLTELLSLIFRRRIVRPWLQPWLGPASLWLFQDYGGPPSGGHGSAERWPPGRRL